MPETAYICQKISRLCKSSVTGAARNQGHPRWPLDTSRELRRWQFIRNKTNGLCKQTSLSQHQVINPYLYTT